MDFEQAYSYMRLTESFHQMESHLLGLSWTLIKSNLSDLLKTIT